ncbi:hypothetical protein [Synoicihabitans lomoniglobus]|uniref:Outer membrane beta-barrel protein n=1 Tax=Synoicihabitans lomoniglobus TaxID=2909285 RepID=A0AAE9ZXU3_9BACT|nr:outer membrane beta-barrel protein [Opitutaceae bacterium LMO-M01]WED63193.1 outer membrane beta-barrel protein [Opitutaceae bacterium LMO-M01]
MMKRPIALILAALLSTSLSAVYAPIPEEDLGQAFIVRLGGGVYHDSNIFGGATGEISSMVYRLAPSLSFNSSLTDQTFLTAGYHLSYDHVEDRPQNQELISHTFNVRLAHAFSQSTTIDFNNVYMIAENPESLLAGIPLNTDQSFRSNQLDGTFLSKLTQRVGYTLKVRSSIYDFDLPTLASQLNRAELLAGASADYEVSEATKVLGEFRYLNVGYDTGGNRKDKVSLYYLAGLDYAPSEQVSLSARVGLEQRFRWGAPDDDAPYAEITGRYQYGEKSFVAAGYIHAVEESSNVDIYTDVQVNRFFVNLQHAMTAQIFGSVFYNVEPSTLNGRTGISPDRDETTQRAGLALTYQPQRHWTVSGTYDYDLTESDDPNRGLERERIGVDVRYSF